MKSSRFVASLREISRQGSTLKS